MTLLLGDSTIEATTAEQAKEKARYQRYKCEHTGTVETLELYCQEAAISEPEVGIYTDSGEAPSTLLAHTKINISVLAKEEWLKASGFSQSVTSGTFYWLAFLDAGVLFKFRQLTGSVKKSRLGSASETTLKTKPGVGALETPQQISFQAVGTESVLLQAAGKTKVLIGNAAAARATASVTGTSAVRLADTAQPSSVLRITASGTLALAARAQPATVAQAIASTGIAFRVQAVPGATVRAAANTRMILRDVGAPSAIAAASGKTGVLLAHNAKPALVAQATAHANLLFATTATLHTASGTTRKVTIFIFDE